MRTSLQDDLCADWLDSIFVACYSHLMGCLLYVLQVIRLTPLQIEQVLIWREEHLRNMLAVYEQRQQLNAEVHFHN